jgi:hypothetical protein
VAPKRKTGQGRRAWAYWKGLPKFARRVTTNLVVGLVIAIALHNLHDLPWLRNADDGAMDWMIRMFAGSAPGRKAPVPFAFINIDEATYRDWNEPPSMPRDRLFRLIDYAVRGQPVLIVVDVDVSRPTGPDGSESEADRKFAADLAKLAARQPPIAPIVFARTFRPPIDPVSNARPEVRRTALDDIFTRAGNLHWAAVGYDREDDGVIRRWQPWEITCTDGEAQVWPSMQILVAAMVRDPVQRAPGFLAGELAKRGLATCKPVPPDAHADAEDRLPVDGLRVSAHPSDLNRRIVYQLPWWDPAASDTPKARPLVQIGGAEVPLLSLRSAMPIANPSRNPPPSSGLGNHIVVIGGSFAESHDIHATPVGAMPGAMVIINSIHSLLEFDELRAPNLWVTLAIETVLLVFISIMFAWLPTTWAKLLCGLGVFALMLPFSFLLFRGNGMWLSFALPLLAVEIHNIAADIEEAIHRGAAGDHGKA